jgi:hypothetical protein
MISVCPDVHSEFYGKLGYGRQLKINQEHHATIVALCSSIRLTQFK